MLSLSPRILSIIVLAALIIISIPLWLNQQDGWRNVYNFTIPPQPQLASAVIQPATIAPPQAWSILVADFADETAAQTLVQSLQQQQYPAYKQTIATPQGNMVQVLIGPYLDRQEATQLQEQAQQQLEKQIQQIQQTQQQQPTQINPLFKTQIKIVNYQV